MWRHFSYELKSFGVFLTMLAFIISMLEVIGLASIIPFLAVISDPDIFEKNAILANMYNSAQGLGIKSRRAFTVAVAIGAIVLFLISLASRALYALLAAKFVANCEYELSVTMFKKYLYSSFEFLTENNTEVLKKNIISETMMVSEHFIAPSIIIFSQS